MIDQQARLDRARELFWQAAIITEQQWQQWEQWQVYNRHASYCERDAQFAACHQRAASWGAIMHERQVACKRLLRAMYPDPMASEVTA